MKKKRSRKQEDIMLGIGALIVIILLVISLSIDNDNGFILKDVSMFIEKIVMLPITKDNKNPIKKTKADLAIILSS